MNTAALQMDILLPRLTTGDLLFLGHWCETKKGMYGEFTAWLFGILADEMQRRETPGAEPGMIDPPAFEAELLSHALLATYILSRLPLTETLAPFIDDLTRHVVCSSVAMLEAIGARQ